jgi:hypothetical protein
MQRVEALPAQQLADIVSRVQGILWRDANAAGAFWNPDKVWDAETVEGVAAVLASHGLRPTAVGRRPESP